MHTYEAILSNTDSPDVEDYFNRPDLTQSRFYGDNISYANIENGEYDVYISMKINDKEYFYKTDKKIIKN